MIITQILVYQVAPMELQIFNNFLFYKQLAPLELDYLFHPQLSERGFQGFIGLCGFACMNFLFSNLLNSKLKSLLHFDYISVIIGKFLISLIPKIPEIPVQTVNFLKKSPAPLRGTGLFSFRVDISSRIFRTEASFRR